MELENIKLINRFLEGNYPIQNNLIFISNMNRSILTNQSSLIDILVREINKVLDMNEDENLRPLIEQYFINNQSEI
jgi:hypothetical protein